MYAKNTDVTVDKSKAEIERILRRYQAERFVSGWDKNRAFVMFDAFGKRVRFDVTLPDPNDPQFSHTPTGRKRKRSTEMLKLYDQEVRRCWRSLALLIKSKFVGIEDNITTFETEFMPHMVLPDGLTVADHLLPKIEEIYTTGKLPKLLPTGG